LADRDGDRDGDRLSHFPLFSFLFLDLFLPSCQPLALLPFLAISQAGGVRILGDFAISLSCKDEKKKKKKKTQNQN